MKSLGLSKQIVILSIVPALLLGLILSAYFTYDQLSYLSLMQKRYGELISRQVQTVAKYSLLNDDIENLKLVLNDIANDDEVCYIKVTNLNNHDIITA